MIFNWCGQSAALSRHITPPQIFIMLIRSFPDITIDCCTDFMQNDKETSHNDIDTGAILMTKSDI